MAAFILTVTDRGYGKLTESGEFRAQNRGGRGVTGMKSTDQNGNVAAVCEVQDGDDVLIFSNNGLAIRIAASDLPRTGRSTQGVRLMQLGEGDKVASVARVAKG